MPYRGQGVVREVSLFHGVLFFDLGSFSIVNKGYFKTLVHIESTEQGVGAQHGGCTTCDPADPKGDVMRGGVGWGGTVVVRLFIGEVKRRKDDALGGGW
eukprot:747084-Hanusia_phi.AAC.2